MPHGEYKREGWEVDDGSAALRVKLGKRKLRLPRRQ